MNIITSEALAKLAGASHSENLISVHKGLVSRGKQAGLNQPHRLVCYLAQLSHESMGFKYDREIWGPTAAQKRYDTRTDLGNTPQVDGDGYKNRGRGPIQVTGGYNIAKFYDWCVSIFGKKNVPDFRDNPDLINTDPWEGLSAIWYWEVWRLNSYCDHNNFVGLTRAINGGTNGLADRQRRWDEIGLRYLGFHSVAGFQASEDKLAVDNDMGPKTRAALYVALRAADEVSFSKPRAIPSITTLLRDFFRLFTGKA